MKEKYLGETGVATLVDYINNNLDLKVNLSDIATVATSGSYNDLIDKPTIPQGTVTSIGLSAPTGFSVSGSPVTSSGTLTLAFASGYSLPTTTKQGQWDSAYSWGNHANAGYALSSNLGTAAAKDVPSNGNASATQVVLGSDSRLSDSRNAADVYAWAKASTKPSYSWTEITNKPTEFTPSSHNHDSRYYISNGAIVLGGSSITPLTQHQTLTNHAKLADTSTAGQALVSKSGGYEWKTLGSNAFTSKTKLSEFTDDLGSSPTHTHSQYALSANLGTAAGKNYTTSVTQNSSDLVTSGAVWAAIDNLPEPMIFKGSLGTGGTITTLPSAATSNTGFTYKVITAGTYASKAAKVGDTFISTGSDWTLIPSGDEPSGTVTSVAVSNGGGLSVSGSPVTSSGTITISHADTSSQGSVSNSGRTYIQSVTLDTYGHVTGLTSATETVTNTDRYVNNASFADNTSTDSNKPVRMTLTRAGSDTATVTGDIPKVSSTTAGVAPKGAAVSSQSQSTKFLREDGTWAAPSYTTNTNTTYTLTQDATDGHKITLTPSSGSATTITIPDNNTNQTIKGAGTTFGANDAVNIVAGNNVTVTPNTTDKTITIASSYTNTNQTVKSGDTTFGANDVVNFVAGSNVTVTPNATNKSITIASSYTDTNQTIKGAGTAFSANDAVNIVAGSNVTVTPNTTDKTITIASSYTNNNQKVKAGNVTFGADDVVNFVAGTNVASIVGNATDKSITINTTNTTYAFDGTYNASTNKAATVSTVTNAINALDGGTIGTPGAGKTLTALSQTNGNVSATFGDISITKSQISDFPSSMTPTSHTHGNISNTGTLTDTAANASGNDYVVLRESDDNKIRTSTIKGTDVADAISKKHSHSSLTLSTTAQAYDGTHTLALPSSDPYSTARTPSSHSHGNITNGGDITATAPTIANGDQLVINDNSESKITNGPTFDGSTTTKALTPKGTWETFLQSHQSLSGYVTGSTLTADKIILGNSNSAIKTSSKGITNTAPSSSSDDTTLPTSAAVWSAISNGIAVADAMVYKGTVAGGSTGSYGALTPAASKGDTYKVTTAGKIDGISVEVGDMLICNADGTAAATSSNYTTIATKWDFIQANIDGAVTGPASSTDAHVAVFNGATGKVIKDSGFTISKSVPSDAKFTDTVYTLPLAADGTRGGIQLGYSQSGKNYPVQLSGEKAYVNVPWTDNNTATAADSILHGSNSGTQITYTPYDSTTATSTWVSNANNAGKLYAGTVNPLKNTRLNYNGNFYANALYSGGSAVLTGITSSMVTTALGYTPYNSTNPNGYTANTGTVTSVGLSAPTGFSVSSSPVTSSGTLTLSFASGYSLPTTAKQSNWDTAYGWGNHASAGYFSSVGWDNTTNELSFNNGQATAGIKYADSAGSLYDSGASINAGSATNPVYFNNGVPVACTYSLNKTVPSNAVFTDTTYESKTAASGGTDVSLVTTGEKYTWNNKISSADLTTHAKVADTSTTNQVLVSSVSGNTTSYNWKTANSSLVGLGNVGNFKAVSTVANQGLSATERTNALQNLGTYIPNRDAFTGENTIETSYDSSSRNLNFYRNYQKFKFSNAGTLSGHSLSIEKLIGNSILFWSDINNPFEDYLTSLTISSIANSDYESVVYFLTSSSGCTLTLPSGTPVFGSTTLEANTKYVMAVRCGVVVISPEGGARISWSDILNKPTIPTVGTLNTTNTTAQSTASSESLGGAINLHKVAKTGTYSDLIGTPTIPTVNNSTITVTQGGATKGSFTLNQSSNYTLALDSATSWDSEFAYTTIDPASSTLNWATYTSGEKRRTYVLSTIGSSSSISALNLNISTWMSVDHYLLLKNNSSTNVSVTLNSLKMYYGSSTYSTPSTIIKPSTISVPAGKSIELSIYGNASIATLTCSGELS